MAKITAFEMEQKLSWLRARVDTHMGSLTRLNAYGFQSPYQSEETKKQIGEYEQQIKILKRILQEHKANAPRDNESAIADIERTIAEAEKHVADLYSQLTSNRAE